MKAIEKTTEMLFTEMLLNNSWNCTYQEASIAKVLAFLSDGTFFKKIEAEKPKLYDGFQEAYQAWRKADENINSEAALENALKILGENGYQLLVNNFSILAKHGIAGEIRHWCRTTANTSNPEEKQIEAVHAISTIAIVEQLDGKFRYHPCIFDTLDEAIIYAIAAKYDGSNTGAHRFICKMLGVFDYP